MRGNEGGKPVARGGRNVFKQTEGGGCGKPPKELFFVPGRIADAGDPCPCWTPGSMKTPVHGSVLRTGVGPLLTVNQPGT
jgi:hypothetical protein